MKICEMNWMQVEAYLQSDDRAVIPLGSTEQHAYLSLSVDSTLSERVAAEAAEPLGIPVFPVLHFGISPSFVSYPGSISLRFETYARLVRDVLDCLVKQGFKRILLVNGHGGNAPIESYVVEWMADHPGTCVKFHSWYKAAKTWEKVMSIDSVAYHASWMENFPWTRLPGSPFPDAAKTPINPSHLRILGPDQVREYLGDGNYGGRYQRPDDEMLALWRVAVDETRACMQGPWE